MTLESSELVRGMSSTELAHANTVKGSGMALEEAERAMQEYRRAVDEILDLIAAGRTGDPLDEALKRARELLDLIEPEPVGDEDIEAALAEWREERARGY